MRANRFAPPGKTGRFAPPGALGAVVPPVGRDGTGRAWPLAGSRVRRRDLVVGRSRGAEDAEEGGGLPLSPLCCCLVARPPAEVRRRLAPGAAERPEGMGLRWPPLGGAGRGRGGDGPAAGAAPRESKGRGGGAPGREQGRQRGLERGLERGPG